MTALSITVGIAVAAWIVAALAALRLMAHRLPDRSTSWYAVRGYTFFSADNFAPSGRATQRAFLLAALVFAVAVIAAIVVAFAKI